MADESLNCFESLLASVPTWIADLENILKTATEKQNEVLFEAQPADTEPALDKKASKSKSSSLRSHVSERMRNIRKVEQAVESKPTLLRPQLPHMTDSDALRLLQRKRKTTSVCSGDHSGRSRFRSRAMAVVYYDGEAQQRFESLVRAIGSCRNAIRKGKMSAKMDSLARSGSGSSTGSSSGDETVLDLKKLGYRSTRSPRLDSRLFGKDSCVEAFDKVDGCLEQGQSLCEKAAHQILRDGDCALELNNAKERFREAKVYAEAELPVLRKRAEKAAEQQRRSDERRRIEEENKQNRFSDTPSVQPTPSVSSSPSDVKLEVDLEVDDSDRDEVDYAITAFQLGKFQTRTGRLTGLAH